MLRVHFIWFSLHLNWKPFLLIHVLHMIIYLIIRLIGSSSFYYLFDDLLRF